MEEPFETWGWVWGFYTPLEWARYIALFVLIYIAPLLILYWALHNSGPKTRVWIDAPIVTFPIAYFVLAPGLSLTSVDFWYGCYFGPLLVCSIDLLHLGWPWKILGAMVLAPMVSLILRILVVTWHS